MASTSKQVPERMAIGIDLGNTFSSIGVWEREEALKVATIPSIVGFDQDADLDPMYGIDAEIMREENPGNSIFDFQRLIARRYATAKTALLPFQVVPVDEYCSVVLRNNGKTQNIYPYMISSLILERLKRIAERCLKSNVKDVVISVPSMYTDCERFVTIKAAKAAGLNVLKLLNETTAIALDYIVNNKKSLISGNGDLLRVYDEDRVSFIDLRGIFSNVKQENLCIFDLGGGSLSVSIVDVKKKGSELEVKGVAGDTQLGGRDFVDNVIRHCVESFYGHIIEDTSVLSSSEEGARSLGRLRMECERALTSLASDLEVTIKVDSFQKGAPLLCTLTPQKFLALNEDFLHRCQLMVRTCLENSGIKLGNVDKVILVGGFTRFPMIKALLQSFFNGKDVYEGVDKDRAVLHGAVIQAAILSGEQTRSKVLEGITVSDVAALSVGFDKKGEFEALFEQGTPIPAENCYKFIAAPESEADEPIVIFECPGMSFVSRYTVPRVPACFQIKETFQVDHNGVFHIVDTNYCSTEKQKGIPPDD